MEETEEPLLTVRLKTEKELIDEGWVLQGGSLLPPKANVVSVNFHMRHYLGLLVEGKLEKGIRVFTDNGSGYSFPTEAIEQIGLLDPIQYVEFKIKEEIWQNQNKQN